jgi:hypothetical protein
MNTTNYQIKTIEHGTVLAEGNTIAELVNNYSRYLIDCGCDLSNHVDEIEAIENESFTDEYGIDVVKV